MAETGSVEIKGLRELDLKLKSLGPKLGNRAVFAALNAGAEVIRKRAKENLSWTKRLKNEITKKRIKGKPGTAKIWVGPTRDGFYGLFLEFGTALRKRKSGGSTGQVSPRPWLRPAFDVAREKAVRVFAKRLGRKIEQLAKKR